MEITAAVTHSKGESFKLETIELDEPKQGEVLIRQAASGICHTDISVRDQFKPVPLPAVLGHEGAGIVERVGKGVSTVKEGDHVVISFSACGKCERCLTGKSYACDFAFQLNFGGNMSDGTRRFSLHGKSVSHFFGQSSFASYTIVNERSVVKIEKEVPLELMAPLGCGIQTGTGAVLNRLQPPVGSSLAVFGCGTVGLSAIMAAKISGCTTIIGVDIHHNRLDLARELGATHTINALETNPTEAIKEIVSRGVDYSIETSANPNVLRQAIDSIAMYGTAVLIGGAPLGTEVKIDMNHLLYGRKIMGVVQGDSVPQIQIPKLIRLYKEGHLPIEKLIKFYNFSEINEAVHDMETGKTIKPIIRF